MFQWKNLLNEGLLFAIVDDLSYVREAPAIGLDANHVARTPLSRARSCRGSSNSATRIPPSLRTTKDRLCESAPRGSRSHRSRTSRPRVRSAAQAPAGRPATPDEIAEAIGLLATASASFIHRTKLA